MLKHMAVTICWENKNFQRTLVYIVCEWNRYRYSFMTFPFDSFILFSVILDLILITEINSNFWLNWFLFDKFIHFLFVKSLEIKKCHFYYSVFYFLLKDIICILNSRFMLILVMQFWNFCYNHFFDNTWFVKKNII